MARSDDRFRKTYNSMLAAFRTMAPGDRLPAELTLAEQNDVSRTIVRSALSRLNAAGIVAWNGRQKELLRLPTDHDHLPDPEEPVSADELERRFFDWILRFDVTPGATLNVAELARSFSVSVPSLQELLASLSRFGLVRRRPRNGWDLIGFTEDFAVELSDFRTMIELNAVSVFVSLPKSHPVWAELATLKRDHALLADEIGTRFNDFSALDERFHMVITDVASNRFIREFRKVISLIFHYHFQWDKSDERDRNRKAIDEHLALISALENRDETAAIDAARKHLATSKETLIASLQNRAQNIPVTM